ncbi:hypothetical protein RSOLAG1IB_10759 [Rhizoctonia solani AG-1 IB]|uniref:Uncharacterized protein n=1 Tax=Thanatephorus cucumeris (strain AG1-IB / isolate 7/3/14) TaxID=1108050 RepID=A0A0B7FZQ8_THACB|nr:hypothetical protein RSOLAG1IB_10759 [Rhizoctonia solani AG-1 IB]
MPLDNVIILALLSEDGNYLAVIDTDYREAMSTWDACPQRYARDSPLDVLFVMELKGKTGSYEVFIQRP